MLVIRFAGEECIYNKDTDLGEAADNINKQA